MFIWFKNVILFFLSIYFISFPFKAIEPDIKLFDSIVAVHEGLTGLYVLEKM